MSLIRVWTEVEDNKFASLPAKIVSSKGDVYTIKYLSPSEKRDSHNRKIYTYEDDTYEITNEYITEYVNSDFEIDFGFNKISETEFIKYDTDSDDEDYVPSSSESDDDDDDEEESQESMYGGDELLDDDED